ncbi:MAG: Fis family transcriptional regulator [Myxococcales bacterium]|nr:Fis family transcriptional regulator [Myxococcales bacterium]
MTPSEVERLPLGELVRIKMAQLLDRLGRHRAPDLYRRVLEEVERALLEEVMGRTSGCQTEASEILGIHRNTLRLRLKTLNLARSRAPRRRET